jgi:hypothetical protein
VITALASIVMYPFRPNSTAQMKAGQFWAFRLRDGTFACGVVIALYRKSGAVDRRMFLAGLLDWTSSMPPTSTAIAGHRIKDRGYAHIKAITENGGDILGEVTPSWGYPSEVEPIDSIPTWGFGVVRAYAESFFCAKSG